MLITIKIMTSKGYSLLEMLISLALSSLIVISATTLYPQLQLHILHYYQQFRLEQSVQTAMAGLIKDVKRAGFIANHPKKMTQKAIDINQKQNCVIIRYDSEIRGDWVYNSEDIAQSDVFAYRYIKNNIEYKTGALTCAGANWDKLFDPNEIKVTAFTIKPLHHRLEIILRAELKKDASIHYQLVTVIKHENI